MTTQEPAGRESFTEWGVRWTGSTDYVHVDLCKDANEAESRLAWFVPDAQPTVVCRTVTRTPWREVRDA